MVIYTESVYITVIRNIIEIEVEEPQTMKCDCCGNTTKKLVRYVSQDDEAFSVYMASFTQGHEEKIVHLLVGLGMERRCTTFAVKLWENEDQWNVTIIDKEEAAWGGAEFLGKILDREEALSHPWIKDVYHFTDYIAAEDKPIIEYFNETSV